MNQSFFEYAQNLGFGNIHIRVDAKTGLHAIIAIHNTKLGPALGGCRFLDYLNAEAAFEDALRLAHAMSYKAALCGLPFGGGKAVLLKPNNHIDQKEYFHAFGEFVNDLQGDYITAIDSGTSCHEMDIIHDKTPYVTCLSKMGGKTSYCTAVGIKRGIEAALKVRYQTDSLKNIRIAIQGVGHVGYELAKCLFEAGAELIVTDINTEAVEQCVEQFHAIPVLPEKIFNCDCDVFSPCALGGILNDQTIPQIRCKIIAGSANNQLALPEHALQLHERNILYAPDYAINAGGLIYCAKKYLNQHVNIDDDMNKIYDMLMNIFERARDNQQSPDNIAKQIAEERLYG